MPRHQALALHKTGRPVGSIDSVARALAAEASGFSGILTPAMPMIEAIGQVPRLTGVEVGVLDDIIFRVDIAIWQG